MVKGMCSIDLARLPFLFMLRLVGPCLAGGLYVSGDDSQMSTE